MLSKPFIYTTMLQLMGVFLLLGNLLREIVSKLGEKTHLEYCGWWPKDQNYTILHRVATEAGKRDWCGQSILCWHFVLTDFALSIIGENIVRQKELYFNHWPIKVQSIKWTTQNVHFRGNTVVMFSPAQNGNILFLQFQQLQTEFKRSQKLFRGNGLVVGLWIAHPYWNTL